ncbi:PD-(D/E)XK motif protein [Phenylobacterium hankyongense]|uniref:PD-(D/E)XK motif protein n=1 Tax=Phenylobacterium hankyongense TaxID=1813876 RepID=UPI001FB380FB|nr:PD-(D/E)XK motif protein [Phenylobacterium hankyongense]
MIRADPAVSIFVDAAAARIGARFAITGDDPIPASPMDSVAVAEVKILGVRHLEVATTSRALFRNFYLLLTDVAFDVVGRAVDVRPALAASLVRWAALLRETVVLTEEHQAGLFGELWVLRRLVSAAGSSAVESWTGHARQSHDFRFPEVELEVKTTGSSRRIHTINGLSQLLPSPGCRLFVVSLRLVDAGSGGETLPELISNLRSLIDGDAAALKALNAGLSAVAYRDIDAPHYPRRRKLAEPASLVPVADGCPRITRDVLAAAPAIYATDLVVAATYDVDLTGLGFADGTPEFDGIIPPSRQAGSGD